MRRSRSPRCDEYEQEERGNSRDYERQHAGEDTENAFNKQKPPAFIFARCPDAGDNCKSAIDKCVSAEENDL